jgi:hypothetical protein
MDMAGETRQELQDKLDEAYKLLNKNAQHIPERLYSALEGFSSMILAWKQAKGQNGWSRALMGPDGNPIFTVQQSKQLEQAVRRFEPQVREVFSEEDIRQVGGAPDVGDLKSGFGEHVKVPISINPEDISIDKAYHSIFDTLEQYDEQWKQIAASLGTVQAVEATEVSGILPTPVGPIPYFFPGKAILPILNVFLDLIRVAFGNPMNDVPTMRILLSVVIGFLELIRGDWQKSVLTLFGVYSSTALVIGLFGKLLRNAWLFMAPDLQRQLRDDIFKSSKSVFVGFLLWSFSIFSPKLIRIAVNNSFEQMRTLVENFNQKAQQVQDKAQAAVGAAGISVSFPKIPLDVVPNMDDIQNLQTIAKIPAVYCSPEFQKILEPVLLVPPLRLIVELLNIPTIEEDKKAACAAVKPGGLANSVADLVTPEVEVVPGGPMDTAAIAEDPSAAVANAVNEKKEEVKEDVEKEEPVTGSVKNKVAAIEKNVSATKKARKGGARNEKKKKRKTRRRSRNRSRK